MEELLTTAGHTIRYYRVNFTKLSLTELHLKAKVDFLSLGDIEETGKVPDIETLERLIAALDWTEDQFMAYDLVYKRL